KDDENASTLRQAIRELRGVETLANEPQVYADEVGEEIVKLFEQLSLVPTLFFVDPWGYKGLSLRLINSVLKDWRCEWIFFNYPLGRSVTRTDSWRQWTSSVGLPQWGQRPTSPPGVRVKRSGSSGAPSCWWATRKPWRRSIWVQKSSCS